MAGFGLLGQLAGGYVNAAREDRARQDALDERQREMQMGLGSMILQNPAVPPEYKGPVMEHLVQVVNTPRGKKLPSWDKMMTSLPATYGPQQTSTVPQPAVNLKPPTPPPGVSGGVAGLPEGVTPQGESQNFNLPASQTQVAGRPQTGLPGQFHLRSDAEMAQEQTAAQMAAQQQFIQSLRDQGFSDEQIALKLGMSKMMPIPFGGLYNIGTGETVSPTNTPQTKVQYMVGGKGPFFGTQSRAGGPILDVSGQPVPGAVPFNQAMNMPVRAWSKDDKGQMYSVLLDKKTNQVIPGTENYDIMPPAGYLPQVKQGEFTFIDADNNVYRVPTTSVTSRAGVGNTGAVRPPAPPPGVSATPTSGTPQNAPQSPPQGTPAGAAGGARLIGNKGPTGATRSRADAAEAIVPLIDQAEAMLRDPEVAKEIGPLAGRWEQLGNRLGTMSPKAREVAGTLMSIYSLGGTMHGWRALQVAKEFANTYGDIKADPESLIGGLEAMRATANTVYESGYKRKMPGKVQPPATPPGQQAAGTHIIELNGKHYQYKGSGDTADINNYTEVKTQ